MKYNLDCILYNLENENNVQLKNKNREQKNKIEFVKLNFKF